MDIKEYFKPNKEKIFICVLLVGISVFTAFFGYKFIDFFLGLTHRMFSFIRIQEILYFIKFYYLSYPFYHAKLIAKTLPIYFTIIIFFLLSYPPACYISKNKKWFKGISLFLLMFLFVSTTIVFAIGYYNLLFGFSCNNDFDCQFACGGHLKGQFNIAYNKRYISLKSSESIPVEANPTFDCSSSRSRLSPICVNSRCVAFDETNAESIKDCERATVEDVKSSCYFNLAEKLNDINLCDRINHIYMKPNCITGFASRLRNLSLCDKIENAFSKSVCIREVATTTKNLSLCNTIKHQEIKEECMRLLR